MKTKNTPEGLIAKYNVTSENGYNVYKEVVVVLDETRDPRIFEMVDVLDQLNDNLIMVKYHKGTVWILWKYYIPNKYENSIEVDIDSWTTHNETYFTDRGKYEGGYTYEKN
jgi:hypothetical protein